jgi:tRNA(Ile)-lysidine synthase
VRPLIDLPRAEGIAFCARAGLAWRDDPTNATPRFARNRLRLGVWPALVALAPAAERALARAADLARADERALARLAGLITGDGASVPVANLAAQSLAVRRRVVRRLWKAAGGAAAALESKHVDAALALARRRQPGRVSLPGGLEARCRYGTLELGPAAPRAGQQPAPELAVPGPGRYAVAGRGSVEIRARDAAAIPWPLALRGRRPGDRFRPDGGRGSKKLKGWLIDRKVPREERDALLVLAAGDAIVAVPSLGVVAVGFGPSGAGLSVSISS